MVDSKTLVLDLQPRLASQCLRKRDEANQHMRSTLAAMHLKRLAGLRFDNEIEGSCLFPQCRDGMFERCSRTRHQPAAEGQERRAVLRRAALDRQRPDKLGLLAFG